MTRGLVRIFVTVDFIEQAELRRNNRIFDVLIINELASNIFELEM